MPLFQALSSPTTATATATAMASNGSAIVGSTSKRMRRSDSLESSTNREYADYDCDYNNNEPSDANNINPKSLQRNLFGDSDMMSSPCTNRDVTQQQQKKNPFYLSPIPSENENTEHDQKVLFESPEIQIKSQSKFNTPPSTIKKRMMMDRNRAMDLFSNITEDCNDMTIVHGTNCKKSIKVLDEISPNDVAYSFPLVLSTSENTPTDGAGPGAYKQFDELHQLHTVAKTKHAQPQSIMKKKKNHLLTRY